jgi:hypothetical protein
MSRNLKVFFISTIVFFVVTPICIVVISEFQMSVNPWLCKPLDGGNTPFNEYWLVSIYATGSTMTRVWLLIILTVISAPLMGAMMIRIWPGYKEKSKI